MSDARLHTVTSSKDPTLMQIDFGTASHIRFGVGSLAEAAV